MKNRFLALTTMITLFFLKISNAIAQEEGTGGGESVTVNKTTTTTTNVETWYMQPWAWIVGGIVLLIVIIALVSSNNKRDSVTVIKD